MLLLVYCNLTTEQEKWKAIVDITENDNQILLLTTSDKVTGATGFTIYDLTFEPVEDFNATNMIFKAASQLSKNDISKKFSANSQYVTIVIQMKSGEQQINMTLERRTLYYQESGELQIKIYSKDEIKSIFIKFPDTFNNYNDLISKSARVNSSQELVFKENNQENPGWPTEEFFKGIEEYKEFTCNDFLLENPAPCDAKLAAFDKSLKDGNQIEVYTQGNGNIFGLTTYLFKGTVKKEESIIKLTKEKQKMSVTQIIMLLALVVGAGMAVFVPIMCAKQNGRNAPINKAIASGFGPQRHKPKYQAEYIQQETIEICMETQIL